jgi:hypothetical protein
MRSFDDRISLWSTTASLYDKGGEYVEEGSFCHFWHILLPHAPLRLCAMMSRN